MRFTVLGGSGGGLLSDAKVFLIGSKDSPAARFIATAFPLESKARPDGGREYGITGGGGSALEFVDAVEIESPILTALLIGIVVVIVGLIVALIVKK